MKKEKLVQIGNVKESLTMLNYLFARPKTEMVGLGLIYGAPGLGKTRFARRYAITNGHMYLRLSSTETARTFAVKLYNTLSIRYNIVETVRGSANKVFEHCVDLINDVNDDVVIFIDEIDYAFSNRQLLGAIRDIVDKTLSTIVLVGMQDAKKNLLKANAHYFDRCNYFVRYKPLTLPDSKKVIAAIADLELDDQVAELVHERSKGTLRKLVKMLHGMEVYADRKKLNKITAQDLRGLHAE